MAPSTLTPTERLQLVNQFTILEKLYPEETQIYARRRDIIANGFAIEYESVFSEVSQEMTIEQCTYVYDVLDMFRILIHSYNTLQDKQGLTARDVCFRGFDGNNEGDYLAFAEHLKEKGKWSECLLGDLNSHSITTVLRYPVMLRKFKPIYKRLLDSDAEPFALSAKEIRTIISKSANLPKASRR